MIRTIDNVNVAKLRLRKDTPESAYFYNPKTGLRIDLLFDFPISASELIKKATKKKIKSSFLHIANIDDLIRLKKIAKKIELKQEMLKILGF